MKLRKLILQNFRGFKGYHEIPLSNLSVFVGKNDIGKSSILEAIDILLGGGTIKFEKDDICKFKNDTEECIIGGIFTSMPVDLVIDETATTTLADEHLLFEDDTLFFFYKTKNTSTLKPFIRSNFPSHKNYKNILDKKLDDLTSIADDLGIDKEQYPYNASIKASVRKAIRDFIISNEKKGLALKIQDISIEKEEGKSICDKILKYLPTYSIFQSDRKNEDQDKEAQDPMKAATKEILGTLGAELSKIETDVKDYVKKLAEKTLAKLAEMNPELADILEPEFSKTPDWSSVFKYSLKTKDEIPLNKRGSGVRRMILLNFFRAKAEKSLEDEIAKQNKCSNDIIYAFEEPETSQHPDHQRLLIESFIDLSKNSNIQIILTTHSPGIAKLLPKQSLSLLKKAEASIEILNNTDAILKDIAEILGILPNIEIENISNVKLVVCVEGHTDISFLNNINNIPELKNLIDLSDKRVIMIPVGGSTMQFWVNQNYLKNLNLAQLHIYDSDLGSSQPNKYIEYVNVINDTWDRCCAFETQKRELENYIHPQLVNDSMKTSFVYDKNWDTLDITSELKKQGIKMRDGRIKDHLSNELSIKMTKDKFEELDSWTEVKTWFLKMKELLEN